MGGVKRQWVVWLATGLAISLLLLWAGCKKGITEAIDSPDIRIKVGTTVVAQDGQYDLGQVSSVPTDITVTIENEGLADLRLSGNPKVALSGSTAFTVSQQPVSPIKPDSSSTFTIRFAPGDTAEQVAVVSIPCNDLGRNPCCFSVVGQLTAAIGPEINIKKGAVNVPTGGDYDFGAVAVGSASQEAVFTIENLGSADLLLTGNPKVTVSGTHASLFMVGSQPVSPVATLSSTTFALTFTPGSVGIKTATVTVPNNDSDEGGYAFTVRGNGATGPTVAISSTAGDPTNASPIAVTITFSEEVSGFAMSDIVVGNGTASNLQSSGNRVFTVGIAPSVDGLVTVDIPAGVAQSVTSGDPNAAALQFGITSDRTKPTGSVLINEGATYTNSTSVTLTLTASDGSGSGVGQMMLSNDGAFPAASWESYTGSRAWTLLSGDGSKTVHAKFRDDTGNESSIYQDAITLDTTAPGAPGTPDLAAADDTGVSDTDNITKNATGLTFSGTSVEAGATVVLYSNLSGQLGSTTADGSGSWSIDATLSENVHNVYAKVTDTAGNTSGASGNLQVTVDLTAPSGVPQILTPFQGANTGVDRTPTFRWQSQEPIPMTCRPTMR